MIIMTVPLSWGTLDSLYGVVVLGIESGPMLSNIHSPCIVYYFFGYVVMLGHEIVQLGPKLQILLPQSPRAM